jgi:ribonuclease P protein component
MAEHPFSFPKEERLCSETRITALFQGGESFMSYPMRVVWLAFKPVGEPEIRVVMSVPKKKLRHAVDRNRVKRLMREAYRLNRKPLWDLVNDKGLSLHIAFIWIPTEVLDYAKVEKKMKDAMVKFEIQLRDFSPKAAEPGFTPQGNTETP